MVCFGICNIPYTVHDHMYKMKWENMDIYQAILMARPLMLH